MTGRDDVFETSDRPLGPAQWIDDVKAQQAYADAHDAPERYRRASANMALVKAGAWQDASAVPELQAAMRLGSRLRLLAIVCPRQETLARVYATTAGPVLVGRDTGGGSFRGRDVAVLLSLLEADHQVQLQCRCGNPEISVQWIRDGLASGRRRLVFDLGPRPAAERTTDMPDLPMIPLQ